MEIFAFRCYGFDALYLHDFSVPFFSTNWHSLISKSFQPKLYSIVYCFSSSLVDRTAQLEPQQKESPASLGAAGLLAEWVGFEPTGERIARWISSPCRYDLFGTTPYFVLLYNSSIPGRICQFSFVQNRRIFANLAAEFWRQSGRWRRGAVAPGARVW